MRFAYLVFFENMDDSQLVVSETDIETVEDIIALTPGLTSANLYTPETAQDLFNPQEEAPVFGLQLHFDELSALEDAMAPSGHLHALAAPGVLSSIQGAKATQQAMYVRHFPVDDATLDIARNGNPCSYVVHYPGPAQDLNVWMHYYIAHHPQVMRQFPGIRGIEILSRLDWTGFLPWERANHMQRNRVMFDSGAALTAALQSPARIAMREDFKSFPPFEGGNAHFPMATKIVAPQSA
ncbi:hypothetical protein [Rhizobium sp. Leaf262]|uniref:hypothetical protein n=1 Tax=Rhizobium sp. Leaf262 TaxID=1736312 RepID=UPI00071365E3|nr:hypothetical protein [Rhizobium sp. Leaf262]KQO83475.1 hypothetical protein ASF29_01190 [Rhizobium sp. Leaf262]